MQDANISHFMALKLLYVYHLSGVDYGEEGAEVGVSEAGARHHGHQVAGVRGQQGAQERTV